MSCSDVNRLFFYTFENIFIVENLKHIKYKQNSIYKPCIRLSVLADISILSFVRLYLLLLLLYLILFIGLFIYLFFWDKTSHALKCTNSRHRQDVDYVYRRTFPPVLPRPQAPFEAATGTVVFPPWINFSSYRISYKWSNTVWILLYEAFSFRIIILDSSMLWHVY